MKLKITVLIVIGVIFIYVTAAKVSESNFACGYCHTLQDKRWIVSTHMDVNCRECHIDPGVSGAFDAQVNGIQNLFVAVTKGTDIQPHEDPIPVSSENCMSCHAAIYLVTEIGWEDLPDNSLKVQGLKIGHRIHVETYDMMCVECHRGVVHRDPTEIGKYEINLPLMHKDCGPCHDGKFSDRFQVEVTDLEDKEKCMVCHPYYDLLPDMK